MLVKITVSKIMIRRLTDGYPDLDINHKIDIPDDHKKILARHLENIKVDDSKWVTDNYRYFEELLHKILYFDYFQEQMGIPEPDRVRLFEFIPIDSVIFFVKNFYHIDKILNHFINLSIHCKGNDMNDNPVIHISGTPGSGKTTLGEKIKDMFGDQVIVYDTDGFIQHHTKEGIELLGIKSETEYKKTWLDILDNKFREFIEKNNNKPIIFTGMLDSFGPKDGTIYRSGRFTHKFFLDVPLPTILKRYYMRICETENKMIKDGNDTDFYWEGLADGKYIINSSRGKVRSHLKYVKWHKDNGYQVLDGDNIVSMIENILD